MSFKWVTEEGIIASAYEYESIDANIYFNTDNPNPAISIISGSLPDGISYTIMDGRIRVYGNLNFVPAPTTISFTFRATDNGVVYDSYYQIYIKNLTVAFISPESIATINETEFLNETIKISNPNGTETFMKVNGKLPNGVTLTEHGMLYGTVGAVERSTVFGFTIRCILNEQGDYIEKYFTITVRSLKDTDAPIWITSSGVLGSYSKGEKVTIKLNSYDPNRNPYKYVLVSGKLPDGLTLTPSNGVISGTLLTTFAGNWAFTVGLSTAKVRVDRQFSIVTNEINPEDQIEWVTDANLGTYKTGRRISIKVKAESKHDYMVTLVNGEMPEGISVETDGTIFGNIGYTTNVPATYSFTLRASNNYCTVDKIFNLTIIKGVGYNNCELALYINLQYYPEWKELIGYFNSYDAYKYYDTNYGICATPLIYLTHDLQTYDRLLLLNLLHFNTPIRITMGKTYKEERYNVDTLETMYDIWYKDIKLISSNDWTMNTTRPYLNDIVPPSPNGNLIDKINDDSIATTQSIIVKDLTVLVEPTGVDGVWKSITSDQTYTETEATPVEKKYTSTTKFLIYKNRKKYIQLGTTEMYYKKGENKLAFGVTTDDVYTETVTVKTDSGDERQEIRYFYIDDAEKIYVNPLPVDMYYDTTTLELLEDFEPEEVLYDPELEQYYVMRFGDKVPVKLYKKEIKYYECVSNHISGETFEPTNWAELTESTEEIEEWVSGHEYEVGQVVYVSNNLYTDISTYTITNGIYEKELYKTLTESYIYVDGIKKNVIKAGKYDNYWYELINQVIAPLATKYYEVKVDGYIYYYISDTGEFVYLTAVTADDEWYDYDTKLYYGSISIDELQWDEEKQLYYIYDPTAPGLIRYVKNLETGTYYETESKKVLIDTVLFDYVNYVSYYLNSAKKDEKTLVEKVNEDVVFYTDSLELMTGILYKVNDKWKLTLNTNKVKTYEEVIDNTWYLEDTNALLQTVIFYEQGDWRYYYKPADYVVMDISSIKDIRDRLTEKIYVTKCDTHGWMDKFTQLPLNIELSEMEIFKEGNRYFYKTELGEQVEIYLERLRYYRDSAKTDMITNTIFSGYNIDYPYFVNSDNVLIAVESFDETMYKFDKSKTTTSLLKNVSDGIILRYVTDEIVTDDHFVFLDKENEILCPDETDCNSLSNLNSHTGYIPHLKIVYANPGSNYESLSEINSYETEGGMFTNKTMIFENVRLYPKFNDEIPQQDIPLFYFNAKYSPRTLI